MVLKKKPSVSESEMEILKVLWEHGPGTVRDMDTVLRRQNRRWAYTTIQTLLGRLKTKGYVRVRKRGVAHEFYAAKTREGWLKQKLGELAAEVCGGSPTPLLNALVEQEQLSKEDLGQLRELLDRLEEFPEVELLGRQLFQLTLPAERVTQPGFADTLEAFVRDFTRLTYEHLRSEVPVLV